MRKLLTLAAPAAVALGLVFAAASTASAGPAITASTLVTNHPDTTNVSGPGCTPSGNGPVWALDNYTMNLAAVPDATPGKWDVTVNDSGTFAGFADPANCAYGVSHGSFTGSITYIVTSPSAPVPADLKSGYNGAISSSTMIADFFNGKATNIAGGDYLFSYQGGNYVQSTNNIHGDVVLDPCAVTIKPIADQSGVLGTTVTGLQVSASTNEATPPSKLFYQASGLPKSLHIDPATGLISGALTGPTGTSLVTIKVTNTYFSNTDENKFCLGVTTFKWTVTLTAPSPTPTPSQSAPSGGNPVGGVQTGGGLPVHSTWVPVGAGVVALGLLSLAFGFAGRRRQND